MEIKKFTIVEVDFEKAPNLQEEVKYEAVEEYSCDGIEEFSLDEPQVDELLGERAYSGGDVPESVISEVEERANEETNNFKFKFYFFNDNHAESAKNFSLYLSSFEELAHSVQSLDYQDWNDEWKKHYKPIEVSERMTVIPEWFKEENYKDNKKAIYIYPGMGFGTGEHDTTYLCLKLLDSIADVLTEGADCLDFGCGSGILGIGAMKMKKMYVEYVDIDKAALDNCVQNLELNFHEHELNGQRLVIRNRFEPKKYELVFANILQHVLLSEKPTLMDSLKEGSYLVLSGILNEQVETIIDAYSELSVVDVVSRGDWSAILLKN